MTLLIVYLLIALVFSFFCSIAEAVLLSVRPAFVRALQADRVRGARTLARLKESIDRPLSAILIVNTVAHTVGAAGVGAQAAAVFGSAYLGVASAILTVLILVFSEIIPKSLGAAYWHRLAIPMGLMVHWMTRALSPLVWLSQKMTGLLAPEHAKASTFSRAEMEAMAVAGVEEGQIDEAEMTIVSNLMRLSELSVRDVMTPRTVLFSRSADTTVRQFFEESADEPFSRIPIYEANSDDVTGYVLKTDVLTAHAQGEREKQLSAFRRDFVAIPEFLTVLQAFNMLLHQGAHAALVVDEYGTVQGLMTQEDVFETLLGLEITDETDIVTDMQQLALKRWRRRQREMGSG